MAAASVEPKLTPEEDFKARRVEAIKAKALEIKKVRKICSTKQPGFRRCVSNAVRLEPFSSRNTESAPHCHFEQASADFFNLTYIIGFLVLMNHCISNKGAVCFIPPSFRQENLINFHFLTTHQTTFTIPHDMGTGPGLFSSSIKPHTQSFYQQIRGL